MLEIVVFHFALPLYSTLVDLHQCQPNLGSGDCTSTLEPDIREPVLAHWKVALFVVPCGSDVDRLEYFLGNLNALSQYCLHLLPPFLYGTFRSALALIAPPSPCHKTVECWQMSTQPSSYARTQHQML